MKTWILLSLIAVSLTVAGTLVSGQEPEQTGAPQGVLGEKYFGFTLEEVAHATVYVTHLRTQHGEEQGNAEFAAWLAEQGSSVEEYTRAYDAFWQRFQEDASGRIEARFHTYVQRYSLQYHYADVPDLSQEIREGVTLEQYARIAVALTREPGAELAGVLQRFGVTGGEEQWQKINTAWAEAMRNDADRGLSAQYGLLYQKYAGPAFAQEQEERLAQQLAGRFQEEPTSQPRPKPPTISELHEQLQSAEQRQRWEAARPFAFQCGRYASFGARGKDDPRPALCSPQVLREQWLPVVIDIITNLPEEDPNLATGLLELIKDFGFQEETRADLQRCVERLRSNLATLEEEFAPIRDKAVPHRVVLRTKIDEHRSAIDQIERELASW